MDSGSIGPEEQPREKRRWSENSKVYTRKVHKTNKNNQPKPSATITNTPSNENDKINNVDEAVDNSNNINNNDVANGTTDNSGNCNESGNDNDNAQRKYSPLKVPAEEAHLSQPQQDSPRLETVLVDSSSHNRPKPPVSNGHDANLANGSVRQVLTRVDNRVNISVSAASSNQEVRKLKRKLETELDQIRKLAKALEIKEIQLSGYSNSGVDVGVDGHDVFTPAPLESLQYPINGRLEKNSEGGMKVNSVGFNGSRPFRRLSVSVMDNCGIGEVVEKEKRTPKANSYYRNSDFLLGKEKLPPAESNKKSKSAGSRKHGGRELDYGFGIDKQIFKSCSNLLQKLIKHKHGWVFKEPVDVKKLGLHDYFDIIKHPMDLGTVKTRLTNNWYKTPREFAEDVRLTFHNAMTYNPEGQDVNIMAKELLRTFEEKWPSIETAYDRKLKYEMIRDLGVPTPTSRKTCAPAPIRWDAPRLLHHPSLFEEARHLERSQSMRVPPESRSKLVYSVGRTPAPKKPKANDPHKRDMTFEEKQRLSTNLQSLPSEKLDAIVQIIKKRNSALSQHDDEIEVDIDSVDAETLWELDRFMTNYKKTLSKKKRKAELALQASAAAAHTVKETITASVNTEATNGTRHDKGNVAISPHMPQERHIDNGSSSSSSSSSSSDSGTSSSDSDSDSDSDSSSSDGDQ